MGDIKEEDFDLVEEIISTTTNETYEEEETVYGIHACRVCLLTDCRLYSLTRLCMEEVYRTVTGLPLSHEDSLPRALCAECVTLLNKYYQFRQKSQRGYYCLIGILEKHSEITLDMVKKVNRKKFKLESNLTATEMKPNLGHQFIDVSEKLLEEVMEEELMEEEVMERDAMEEEIMEEELIEEEVMERNAMEEEVMERNAMEEEVMEGELALDYDTSGNENHLDMINDYTNPTEYEFTTFKTINGAIEIPLQIVKKRKTQTIMHEENILENVADAFVEIEKDDEYKPVINIIQNYKENIISNDPEEPTAKLKRGRKRQEKIEPKDIICKRKQFNVEYLKQIKDNFHIKALSLDEQKEELCKRKLTDNYITSVFKCEYCFQGFKGDATYNTHMIKHSEKYGSLACDVCHKRCLNRRSMLKHLQDHSYLYSCLKCSYTTQYRGNAKLHLDWHKGKSYKCTICEEVYRRSSSLLSHLRIKHPSDSVCTFCGYSFIGQYGLKTHRYRKHRQEKEEISSDSPRCVECDIHFVSEAALQTHLQVSLRHASVDNVKRNEPPDANKKAKDRINRSERGTVRKDREMKREGGRKKQKDVPRNKRDMRVGQTRVTCKECGRHFFSLHSLRIHLARSHPVFIPENVASSFLCEQCGRVFRCLALLRDHAMVHSDKASFTCTVCGKSYKTPISLRMHSNLHVEKYPCPQCDKIFNSRSNRDRHLTNVHSDIRDVKCSFCEKLFKSDDMLKAHTDHVHLKKPWPKRNRQRARKKQTTPINTSEDETTDESTS